MSEISLKLMSRLLAHRFYKEFIPDPDLFQDKTQWKPFDYSERFVDARIARYKALGRVYMAVMLDGKPIGEIVLKQIDYSKKCCTMGISMINYSYKNQGYGTVAEKLILQYAFDQMGLQTVYADSLTTNLRSQHVLQKVGFAEIGRDAQFVYYRCDKPQIEAEAL